MMKSIVCLLFFFLLTPILGISQIQEVRDQLNKKLAQCIFGTNWQLDTLDPSKSTVFNIDTFSVTSGFNPIRGHQKHDTLFISFKMENNWSSHKIDSIEKMNLSILTPIIPKYIHYYDSIGWGKARVKKNQLLKQPKSSILQDWFKSNYITDTERKSLFRLTRLPDTLIGSVGVFHNRNFPPRYIIKPASIKHELDGLLIRLNEHVLSTSTILRNEGFFLQAPFKEAIRYSLHVQYEDKKGIVQGSPVLLHNNVIGEVIKITTNPDSYILELVIHDQTALPFLSEFWIKSDSTGKYFITIHPSDDQRRIRNNDYFLGAE